MRVFVGVAVGVEVGVGEGVDVCVVVGVAVMVGVGDSVGVGVIELVADGVGVMFGGVEADLTDAVAPVLGMGIAAVATGFIESFSGLPN